MYGKLAYIVPGLRPCASDDGADEDGSGDADMPASDTDAWGVAVSPDYTTSGSSW